MPNWWMPRRRGSPPRSQTRRGAVLGRLIGDDAAVTSREPAADLCPTCGRPRDAHDRHVRFRLPDPVVSAPDRELTEGTWMSHADANQSVMMMVPNVGTFVRVLVPVHLTGGYTVTFGAWLGVHPDDLQRAFSVWTSPSYVDLRLEGRLANALPAWDVFAVPAEAAVKDPDHTPYLVGSSDSVLSEVLTQEWPHETILSGLP